MSDDPWGWLATKRALIPFVPPELDVVAALPLSTPMQPEYEDGERVESGKIVGLLVLEGPDGYAAVVGVLADHEGLHVAEEAVNFTGYATRDGLGEEDHE